MTTLKKILITHDITTKISILLSTASVIEKRESFYINDGHKTLKNKDDLRKVIKKHLTDDEIQFRLYSERRKMKDDAKHIPFCTLIIDVTTATYERDYDALLSIFNQARRKEDITFSDLDFISLRPTNQITLETNVIFAKDHNNLS